MSAVFITEPEPRRAPSPEQLADFLRRYRLTISVKKDNGLFTARLPAGYFVADYMLSNPYDRYGTSTVSALDAVQRLAGVLAGRYIVRPGHTSISVPPLLIPSTMNPRDWVTRDGTA